MLETDHDIVEAAEPQRFNGIDLMKFLCAILVFLIHFPLFTPPLGGELSVLENYINFGLQQYLCRLAVPFYFVCSGFFLFRKMPNQNLNIDRVKNYCFKLVRLIGMWSILLYVGGQEHLWYLGATIVAITFLSICLYRRVNLKWLLVIACIFYALGLLGDSYFGLVEPIVSEGTLKHIHGIYKFFVQTPRNGFYMGYIFVLMGYVFAQGKIKLKAQTSLIAFIISMMGLLAEIFLLKYNDIPADYNMYICLLPSVFFLFAFVSSIPLKNRPIFVKLRTVSVLVYFLHVLVNSIVVFGMDLLHAVFEVDIHPLLFFISLPATLFIAFGIEWLSHKEKFTWITWFFA